MDNNPNWALVTNSPYLLIPNPFYIPSYPPAPPPVPPSAPPLGLPPGPQPAPPVFNHPGPPYFNIEDVGMDHIFQLFDQPGIEYPNPPHENLANPLDPNFFEGVLQIRQNQLLALHIPSEIVLIEILGRRLRNEPINEIWINQINFYQHSPATLAGNTI